jgi:uncharacterized protein YecE (DUF72 family)
LGGGGAGGLSILFQVSPRHQPREGPGGSRNGNEGLFRASCPLGHRLGPFFLQLHESFGSDRLSGLERYLDALPKERTYAVEVRAPEFFAEGQAEARLDAVLTERDVNRVIFDTRALFASSATDTATLDAKRKKPRVPVRRVATGRCPFRPLCR